MSGPSDTVPFPGDGSSRRELDILPTPFVTGALEIFLTILCFSAGLKEGLKAAQEKDCAEESGRHLREGGGAIVCCAEPHHLAEFCKGGDSPSEADQGQQHGSLHGAMMELLIATNEATEDQGNA